MKKIFLTVDVECHDYDMQNQYLWGKKGDKEYGIKQILELGKELNIPINFFVDFAECNRYGKEFIVKIVDLIKLYNQGVYLHLHPNFISGDDNRTFLWQYSYDEQLEILKIGLDNYRDIMKRNNCPSFRVGRYGANDNMYKAMKELKINTIDLSYCCYCPKMCNISYDEVQTFNKPIKYNDQIVFPNTRYIGFKLYKWTKLFNIDTSDTTLYEFKKFLKMNTLKNVTCTMHSWNFIKKYFFTKKKFFGNRYEIKKFKKMVDFAEKSGYVFCDIERDFSKDVEIQNDEILDICKNPRDKLMGLVNNFFRFQRIARLNKKYFLVYFIFYSIILSLIIFCGLYFL